MLPQGIQCSRNSTVPHRIQLFYWCALEISGSDLFLCELFANEVSPNLSCHVVIGVDY
jgi:hypothetical protein